MGRLRLRVLRKVVNELKKNWITISRRATYRKKLQNVPSLGKLLKYEVNFSNAKSTLKLQKPTWTINQTVILLGIGEQMKQNLTD